MELAQIFQAIEETQFLKKLSSQERLFFVGDTACLKYLKNFFAQFQNHNHYYYYDISTQTLSNLDKTTNLNRYQAIVIVSLENEDSLWSSVNQQLRHLASPKVLKLFADIFINLLCGRQLLQTVPQQNQKPQTSYAILTTPRSGSTYLCDLLDSTGIAGHPGEHLRLATQELSRHCNFDYLKLLRNLMEYRTTNNGVFGTKLISHFLFELRKAKPDFQQIFQSIDKFILLIRQDKLAQAVSLVIAQRTDVWHLRNNSKQANYQSQLANIEIDDDLLNEVEYKVRVIEQQENNLKNILANNQIQPLLVVYEDILQDTPTQINRILDFLKIVKPEPNTLNITSGIKRMPSNISRQIIQQYHARNSVVH